MNLLEQLLGQDMLPPDHLLLLLYGELIIFSPFFYRYTMTLLGLTPF